MPLSLQDGTVNAEYTVSSSGTYKVSVTNGCATVVGSILITVAT